ncbi:sarcoplasmic calcium-binding protein-like isoform X2 [Ruditapes philippinarum]|uniref:sarcoplasmic calcium-binding protein-like isoform X2 n=1 Tax=Ruditapes philippinarum TaxID=129788 RepID=UPI00295C1728|nr:sarcoplasmic calcium-binding protein-like isoform X2 [Ruditapes philippinarum]
MQKMVIWTLTLLVALSLKACAVAIEQESNKANGYLIDKWGKFFDFDDFNHDGILSFEDPKAFLEHYKARDDLTDKQKNKIIKEMDRLWKVFYFTNKKELSKDDFINMMKQRYESNITACIELVRAFSTDWCKLLDLDEDTFLSKNEFIMDFVAGTHNSTQIDEQFFYMYNPVNDRFPVDDLIESCVIFATEPDSSKPDIFLNGILIGV